MIRTQIYLPKDLHLELTSVARRESTSLSDVIRKRLEKSLAQDKKKKKSGYEFLEWLIEDGRKSKKKLPPDISTRHTEYYLESVIKDE